MKRFVIVGVLLSACGVSVEVPLGHGWYCYTSSAGYLLADHCARAPDANIAASPVYATTAWCFSFDSADPRAPVTECFDSAASCVSNLDDAVRVVGAVSACVEAN